MLAPSSRVSGSTETCICFYRLPTLFKMIFSRKTLLCMMRLIMLLQSFQKVLTNSQPHAFISTHLPWDLLWWKETWFCRLLNSPFNTTKAPCSPSYNAPRPSFRPVSLLLLPMYLRLNVKEWKCRRGPGILVPAAFEPMGRTGGMSWILSQPLTRGTESTPSRFVENSGICPRGNEKAAAVIFAVVGDGDGDGDCVDDCSEALP